MEVRRATAGDLEKILDLQVRRNGPECGPMIRGLVDDPDHGIECLTVAVADGRIVSSLALMRETLVMESKAIPVGRPELIATSREYEHRGMVRAQLDLAHEWSAARGDLAQLITGIPYFYRRFGYEYAIPTPRVRLLNPGASVEMPSGWTVRRATPDDLDRVVELSDAVSVDMSLRSVRPSSWWVWWLTAEVDRRCYVAEHGAQIGGCAFVGNGPPGIGDQVATLSEVSADHEDAVWALLNLASSQADGRPVGIEERAGRVHVADGISHRHPRQYAFYVRVADPAALLAHLEPVLSARLQRSHRATASGSLLLSLYGSSMTINYERGTVTSIVAGGPQQDPLGNGGIGVPPDLMATLIFGRHGAGELADRHPDVRLGPHADLAEVLFPRLDSDLVLSM